MSEKEQLSLLDLKGKILFADEPISTLEQRLSTILNEKLENFTNKLFISKNDKVEAVIIPIEEYELLKEVYTRLENIE